MSSDLSRLVPHHININTLCFTYIHCQVTDFMPDITVCSSNGYMYEIKNKMIIGSLHINEQKLTSISAYHINENKVINTYYFIVTATHKLIIVKQRKNFLQKIKVYDDFKKLEINDFKCIGYPQIKITFTNSLKDLTIEFPLHEVKGSTIEENEFEYKNNCIINSLAEKVQMAYIHIDELIEEHTQIKKMCAINYSLRTSAEPSDPLKSFSSKTTVETGIVISFKWHKICGKYWVLGLQIHNTTKKLIPDVRLLIIHKNIKKYTYCCFPTPKSLPTNIEELLLSSGIIKSLKPDEKLFLVGFFELPVFKFESRFSISYYIASSNFDSYLKKKQFHVNLLEMATTHTIDNFIDIMVVIATSIETKIAIDIEKEDKDLIESILVKKLGFEIIPEYLKDKVLYCTSNYLKDVGIILQWNASQLSKWKMYLYTSQLAQIYFIINAFYELLPEKAILLVDQK